MATYDKEIEYGGELTHLKLKERYIYGSSRVGVRSTDIDMLTLPSQNYSMKTVKYDIGGRTYELSNHLGNVLSVVSDKVIPSFDHGAISGMLADIRSAQDYSPFGVTLSGRNFTLEGAEGSRYGFNGQEKDDEVAGAGNSYTAEYWQYDPRLGRRWNRDPVIKEHESPYACFANNPIWFADPSGADSTLANGSNTWQWTARKGETYSEIAKKTGASVANLRLWNGYKDTKIPIGSELNISDPSAAGPASPGVMHTPAGDITVLVREPWSDSYTGRYNFGLTFTPNDADKGAEFVWYQTYVTNDANQDVKSGLYTSEEDLEMFTYRCLRGTNNLYFGDDLLSGGNKGTAYANGGAGQQLASGTIFKPANGTVPFFDSPRRANINTGTVTWNGYLQLLKKVDGNYIKVATIKWGLTLTGGVITPNVTIFNPDIKSGEADTDHHNKKLNQYINR